MGRVTTNNTQLSYAAEDPNRLGELPASPEWTLLEPNDITDFGTELTTTPRNPISPTRQRRKGEITDLDSTMGFEHDMTYGLLEEFIPAFAFARRTNDDLNVYVDAVTATGYTVTGFPVGARTGSSALFVADGFGIKANDGLKVLSSAATAINIPVTGLTPEPSPPKGARLRFAGHRLGAASITTIPAANITVPGTSYQSWTGGAVTITTTGINWMTVGLSNGQVIGIFKDKDNYIWGRVRSTSATTLRLDKATMHGTVAATDDLDFLYGGFVRNVSVSSSEYLERSYTFEATWDNLENDPNTGVPTGADEYEYSVGNYCNSFAFNLAGQSFATATVGFIGTDTMPPVGAGDRKTGADDPFPAPRTHALNTTADIARLRMQGESEDPRHALTTDFDSMTLTLNNTISPEKVLGSLAARYINLGNFEVDIETDIIFSNSAVLKAVRENDTVTMDFILFNDQGAVAVDIPSMTLGLGGRNLPRDESVTLSMTAQAFGDDGGLNTSLGVSFIPYIPI